MKHYFTLESKFGTKAAKLICKVNYWISRCGRDIENLPGKWIYNTIDAWAKQLSCSQSTIKRAIKLLEEQEILLSNKVNAKRYNQTKWYSLNYSKLQSIGCIETAKKKCSNEPAQCDPILSCNSTSYTISSKNGAYIKKQILRNRFVDIEEEELIKKMVVLWNEVFKHSISPIKAYCSAMNSSKLISALKDNFNGDLSAWQNYAKMVNSSKFLMGEKETKKNFKAIFSWLLEPSTIVAISSGEYGVGDRKLDMDNQEENEEQKNKKIIREAEKILEEEIKKTDICEEFTTYIEEEKWRDDDDRYRVAKYFGAYLSSHQVLHDARHKSSYNMILKEYTTRKKYGISMTNIRKICAYKLKHDKNYNLNILQDILQIKESYEILEKLNK
jgi:hypothetical protein